MTTCSCCHSGGVTDADLKVTRGQLNLFSSLSFSFQKQDPKEELRFSKPSVFLLALGKTPKVLFNRLLGYGSFYKYEEWSKDFHAFSAKVYDKACVYWKVNRLGPVEPISFVLGKEWVTTRHFRGAQYLTWPLCDFHGRTYSNVTFYEMYGPEHALFDRHLYTTLDGSVCRLMNTLTVAMSYTAHGILLQFPKIWILSKNT